MMVEVYTDEQLRHLTPSRRLRHIIYQSGGTWTPQRALYALEDTGWECTGRYPLNVAGNLLSRLWDCGALIRRGRGVYDVQQGVLAQVLAMGIRRFEKAQRENPTVERRPGAVPRASAQRPVNQSVAIAPPN